MFKRLIMVFLLALALIIGFQFSINAKPMDSPKLEEAIRSECIVIAEYISYNHDAVISYFHGPIAEYKVTDIIKGKLQDSIIKLHYDFQDGSACIAERNWVFSDKLMPEKGSRWILFLKNKEAEIYITYRGDYGRWPFTKENLQKVKQALSVGPEK